MEAFIIALLFFRQDFMFLFHGLIISLSYLEVSLLFNEGSPAQNTTNNPFLLWLWWWEAKVLTNHSLKLFIRDI